MKISTKRIKIIQLYTILSHASKNRLDISQWIFSNVQQTKSNLFYFPKVKYDIFDEASHFLSHCLNDLNMHLLDFFLNYWLFEDRTTPWQEI